MFNGYNETPLISSYNDFDQEREKKQENGGKWSSYGPDQFAQHHSNNRQSEFWSPKPNLIGIPPSVVNIPSKCNCSGCYSSPENQSYQGDSARHRPWLPRTFPIPLNGSNESCKLPVGYHQWDNVGLSAQGPCYSEGNPLSSQYLQENGGKHPYYRSYQNSRLSEPNQPGVITSVKNSDFVKKDVLLKQKDEMPANSAHEMVFYGQNGTKQSMFCNPDYNLSRSIEKRMDSRSCSSSYCDPSEKYTALESCRHSANVASYGLEQHVSRHPVVEPYMKTVPSNLNQNRVPSTGHRSLKENKSQSYIDQSYGDARKMMCSEGNQAVNRNKSGRPVYPPAAVVKEGTACENYQSGQLHNIPPPMAMDLKSGGVHIDYSHFNAGRDFSRSCANMSESETQKFMFENNRHSDYYSRNSVSDVIKRNNQVPLLDAKKDCAINQIGQMNMSEQHCGNLPRSNHISGMPKYLEVGNSKSSCGVYYAKDYNGDKISKSDKFDQMPENPMTFQRSEDGLKNDNLNVHARIPRSALVFNDPRDSRFADRTQNSYSYQNNTIAYKNYVRSEYPYQGYNAQGRYEYPHVPHGASGLQRNDPNQYNHRVISQQQQQQPPNFGSDQFLPHVNNSFVYDPHCQQSGTSEKNLSQQFCDSKIHSLASSIPVSSVSDHHSVDVRLDLPLEVGKPNNVEAIRAEDVNKNGNSKISPLRLLRKKKFMNQKNETVLESIPSSNTPTDTVPALDVRKFWSTWAEEEDENMPTQMVVLDCQNIDPEQAKFLHLYENDPTRAMRLENGGVVTLKGSSCDKDPSNQPAHFSAESQELNIGYDQVSLPNEPKITSPVIGKQNCENNVEISKQEDAPNDRKSFEGNLQVDTLDTSHEKKGSSKGSEIEPPSERPVESVDQKTEIMSPKNDGKPCKRGRSRASQESKEGHRGKKVNLEKKTEKVNQLDKWTEKKFDFLKRAEESKAAEILRHEEEKKRIFERRLSFQQGNVTNDVKKVSPNSKTPIVKGKLEMINKEAKSSFANSDFEKKTVSEIFKSLSPFDDNSISNSSEDSKGDLPNLPTSEYRRNKFLDYSEKKLFANNSFSSSLENLKGLDLECNGEAIVNEDTNAKGNEHRALSKGHHSLPVSEMEEIKKEKLIKQEYLTNNNWPSSEKYLTEKLGNNIFHSSLDESLIDNIKLKGESGLHSFVMEDILKKMSEINFQNPEVKSESIDKDGIASALKSELVVEKATKSNKRVKKAKKLEHEEESDERTDKLTVENISVSKPTIKFSIQKSHDLKISFKVLNSSKKYEKCESGEDAGRKEAEGKNDSVDESKNSTELITLKLKSVQRDGSNCERSHKLSKKIPFSRNGSVLKKNRRRFRRKKIRGDGLSPLKTPVLKIKKSRYLLEEDERDPLAEDTDYEKCLNLSRKPCSDEYSTSDDFQVQETIDSAKIKLTFKRHRANFEREYKIDNNDDDYDEDDNNNHNNNNNEVDDLQGDLEPEDKFKVVDEFDNECPSVTKTRFKKKSKRTKHRGLFDEGSVKFFKCEGENAKEPSEPNVDCEFETIPKEGELKSVPEEGSADSASLQDLFGEDENYNFNEEEEEVEEPESKSRFSPRDLSDLPLIAPPFQTHGNGEEGEDQTLNFPDVNSNCFLEGDSVKERSVENVSTGSESLIENDVGNFLAESKSEVKVSPVGVSHTNDDELQKEVRLDEMNTKSDEDRGEEERKCEDGCLGETTESPEDDETLQEYPTGTVRMGDAVESLISAVGDSGKETNFEGVDIGMNHEDTSLGSIRTYSHENENKEMNYESDKNDSNTLISRDDSFECEDLENDIDGMNYGEEIPDASDDNNNNNDDNAKQLICSGQNYEDEKSSELLSSDSSTNEINHSKNQSSYESEADKDKEVEKTYPADSSINYYCPDEGTGEGSNAEVADCVKDGEYAEGFPEKVDDWKNYSNSLISDVDDELNGDLSNPYELEGNRLFEQVDSLLTNVKNFNEGDVEMDNSQGLLDADKFSAGENSTSLGLLDTSESQNDSEFGERSTKSEEDSKPGDELDKVDQDSMEKVENETNVSYEENDQEEKTESPREVECSQSLDKADESCIAERNERLNEKEKDVVDQADESATTETPDFYSSPLSPKSVNQSGDNSRLGDDDSASDLKQIDIGGSERDVKVISEFPDPSKEENQLSATSHSTDKSLSLVETIFSDIGCERNQIGESSAYGDTVVDFISEFSDNQKSSSDALDANENVSNEVPDSHSNYDDLEEGEIVDEDSVGCSKEILPEDGFLGMTKEAEPIEEETVFDLRHSESFCANDIDSARKERETIAGASRQNGEESNGKLENVNIPLDVNVGNDCKIKNSCRYFLDEIEFGKSRRIRRRHSLKVETLGKSKSGKSEKSTESQKFKFDERIFPQEKRSRPYHFKAQSCPPSVKSFSGDEVQVQIAVLDIPVGDIPLPPGDPPPENCFNLEEYFKKLKNVNETRVSESNLDLELFKATEKPEENRPKEDEMNPLISFSPPKDVSESVIEELNVTSKQLLPLKEDTTHLPPSSANCKSPFASSDLTSCRNLSPPQEKHHVSSTSDPVEYSRDDPKPEEIDESSEIMEDSSREIKMEDSVITKSEEIDWSPLNRDEGWLIGGLDEVNVDSSGVLESPVDLIPKAEITELSLNESIPFTQGMYDDITKSPIEVDMNFENEDVKTPQTFSLPIFSNAEEEATTGSNNQDSDEIIGTKEKNLKEQEEIKITDSRAEKKEKTNESEVVDDKNCTVSEIKDAISLQISTNAGTDEIQNDYVNASPLKLICEDVDMEEMEMRDLDSKTVDIMDDDSLNVLGFENDDYIRNEFYECEDIPTSEDLPNGDQNEDDKVSDDDKFRNIMQNCLDNAKKFLNEGNLKLFSGSVDDLLELDCQMISENEAEKSTSDSANHISRDVLLTSCEDTTTDDLGLSQKFQPEDLSMDFVPSFCSDGSNNLCPEILPVDNWPYLEEEVPLSPTKPKQDETDLLPLVENVADEEDNISEQIDEVKSQDVIPPVVNNGSFRAKKRTLNGAKGNTEKLNRLKLRRKSFPVLENSSFKRFRRKSLLTENQTFKMRSSITAQRRKTIDGFTGDVEPSVKAILDDSGVVSELETETDKTTNTWQGGKSLKCRLSLEKLRNAEPYQDKYKSTFNTDRETESEYSIKDPKTVSKDVKWLKPEESSKKSDPTHTIPLKRKNFTKYKTSSWQPKVMLSRISQKELKRIRGKGNLKTKSVENRISSKRNSQVDKAISEDELESREVDEPKSAFKKQRPNSSNSVSESCEFEQDIDSKGSSETPKLYVKSNSKNRLKYTDEGLRNDGYQKSSIDALDKHAFGSHKLEKPSKHKEKESHRGSEGSCKAQKMESCEERLDSPASGSIEIRKHKKSRFRNLHSSKKSELHSNLNPVAKDISSPAQNILPLDDPKLVDAERVLSEIFRDCDSPQEEVLNSPKKSTKGSNSKSEDGENVKKKLSLCKDEITQIEKKAKNSVYSPKNVEEHSARISCKSIHGKQNHSSPVSEKPVKTGRESDKGHYQISNKHSRESSSKRRRSESVHSHKDEKREINEKGYSKYEERKGDKCGSRERHKSESERHSRHERKREKHDGTKDRRKEGSRHNRHESSTALKSQSKERHTEAKNSKGFVRREDDRSKGSPEVDEKEICGPAEPDLDSPWVCEVCGFDDVTERIGHIKTHPFHCQSCHLAFKTESYFISHLTKKHKDIRNQHHCLLCELSFDTEEQYQHHLETREHRHLESVEKNTINTLFTLLTGQPCPVLGLVEMKPEWLPNQAGTVHFYHQATPLSLALQYLKMHHDLSSSSTVASAHLN